MSNMEDISTTLDPNTSQKGQIIPQIISQVLPQKVLCSLAFDKHNMLMAHIHIYIYTHQCYTNLSPSPSLYHN